MNSQGPSSNSSDAERLLWQTLQRINDPEMPISIVDLGLVELAEISPTGVATVELLPTFVGCPALTILEDDVRRQVGGLPGVRDVQVRFVFSPPWSVERISDAGRESLRRVGITTPARGSASRGQTAPIALTIGGAQAGEPTSSAASAGAGVPACPLCGSAGAQLESAFGPTRCKMIYYCNACRNSFEHLKTI